MAGLFPSDSIAVGQHILADIFITHRGLYILHPLSLQSLIESQIGHDRSHNHIVFEFALLFQVLSADIHNQITVHHISFMVYSNTAVRVPIVRKADVQAVFLDKLLQNFDVGRAAVSIDVGAVRLVVDYISFRPQRVENTLGNRRRTPVGTVQSHLDIFEIPGGNRDQITNVAVSPRRKIHRAPNVFLHSQRNLLNFTVDIFLNLLLNLSFDFLSVAIDDLNSIVIKRIVTG